jgi:hypothetical protein
MSKAGVKAHFQGFKPSRLCKESRKTIFTKCQFMGGSHQLLNKERKKERKNEPHINPVSTP